MTHQNSYLHLFKKELFRTKLYYTPLLQELCMLIRLASYHYKTVHPKSSTDSFLQIYDGINVASHILGCHM